MSRGEGGRGFWTQNLMYQKWPDQIFPFVNFVFSRDGHFGLGGGGGLGRGVPPAPPWVLIILKKPWGGVPPSPPLRHVFVTWRLKPWPGGRGGGGALPMIVSRSNISLAPPPPLCDIPSGCCFFTGPWTVTRSSLRMLRRVAAFCRPLRPVLLLVSFPRSRSPVVGVLGLC